MHPSTLTRLAAFLVFLLNMLSGVAGENSDALISAWEGKISPEALRIHRSALVVDGHNDLPWEIRTKGGNSFNLTDISRSQPQFHTDIPRLRQGGVSAQFWAAYVPAVTMKTGQALRQTLEQIDLIHSMVERYPEVFEFAGTAGEIERIARARKIACLIGVEGGHSMEKSLSNLRNFYRLGVRYMTLTHSDSLDWADAATDQGISGGLSAFGKDVIREMNRLGMLVDISHVSEKTMLAALETSMAPVIASHSCAYTLAPHVRNVPDSVLHKIKANGGVVMINFFTGFLTPEAARLSARLLEVHRELREKFPVEAEYRTAMAQWRKDNPLPPSHVRDVVDHIEYIRKLIGIEHIGLGGDFDGVTSVPVDLKDVSGYPKITEEMLRRGFAEPEIKAVLGGNILRALRGAERTSAELRGSSRPNPRPK